MKSVGFKRSGQTEWAAPKGYKLQNDDELTQLVNDKGINHVVDTAEYVADDMFEMTHPDKQEDATAREEFAAEVAGQGASYGQWFHYDYDNTLVRFPEEDDHYNLRTFRNRNLITADEQRQLRERKIAAFGLSVGSNVVDSTVQSGIGNEYLLFDYDRLSPTNLNRIRAKMGQVGLLKTVIAGRKMAELDPYIVQKHFNTGYDENTDDILRAERPDIIIEEVDDMEVKARLRAIAMELAIPIVTTGDVGDKSTLDVERYDLGEVKPFNGKLSQKEFEALLDGTMTDKDKEGAMIRILGFKNLSTRLLDSAIARGKELAGFPQLGTTAATGGAMTAVAIRDIFLNRGVESGSRVHDTRKAIKSGRATTLKEDIDILKRFIKYRKGQE